MTIAVLKTLNTLQLEDSEILSLEQTLDSLYSSMRELKLKIETLENNRTRVEVNLQGMRVQMNRQELNFKEIQDNLEELRSHLKESRNLKDYHGLNSQISSKATEAKVAEDDVLKSMDIIEKMEEEVEGLNGQIETLKKEIEEAETSISGEVKELQDAIDEHQKKRDEIAKDLDPDLLEEYTRLFKHFEGEAICRVEDKTCQGCFMSLTANHYVQVVKGEEIIRCPSCGRILYNGEHLEG